MGKQLVGTYHSELETIDAIDGLKYQGYQPTDITVIAQNQNAVPKVAARTGARVESGMPVNTLTGAMMDSFFTLMTGGMMSSHSGLAAKLYEMGIPEFMAKRCESELNKGKILVMVDTNLVSSSLTYSTGTDRPNEADVQRQIRLHEEQLAVTKERVQVGEVQLRKEIVEEQRTILVPLMREEIYVERRPVVDGTGTFDATLMAENEMIRVPIIEERIQVTKRPIVVEEVIIGKRKIQETQQVQDTIRKEEAHIERLAVPSVSETINTTNILTVTDNKEEGISIGTVPVIQENQDIPNLLTVPESKEDKALLVPSSPSISQEDREILDVANEIINETKETVQETKEAVSDEQSTPSAVQGKKNASISADNKKGAAAVERSKATVPSNKIMAISPTNKEEESDNKHANAPVVRENKNTTNQENKKEKD
ncbi:YsnF/AvaK domain-containing protein [Aneurinibacillus tyrosinisolvens]|uniref:YsnF/AvaK domain-containing protein n=1 Tax=Aneurinibacillus tyrosinisolvens TaxID=1443435 RepID=UPI00069A0710|nr:YsnF/AvaK domain-containing protein [Aneurinibacillus tyrosinisolvens]